MSLKLKCEATDFLCAMDIVEISGTGLIAVLSHRHIVLNYIFQSKKKKKLLLLNKPKNMKKENMMKFLVVIFLND